MTDGASVATGDQTREDAAVSTGLLALILNPVKVSDADALVAALTQRCVELGRPAPLVLHTSQEDPGHGVAKEAIERGAVLVLAAGGDGTVRAVAEALTGTGVVLGVLPQGTGNLLARNLNLPIDLDTALEVALTGLDRSIDVGRLSDGTVFVVMAGAGFDALMMREAPEGLKAKVGWPAYLVGAARSMRHSRVSIELRLDGGPAKRAVVRTVIIGNLGRLQAGLELLPDAVPDDGLLDICVVAPRRAWDWVLLVVIGLFGRHHGHDHRMRTYQASSIALTLHRSQPRQVDGDLIDDGRELTVQVVPGALVIRVPADEAAAAAT